VYAREAEGSGQAAVASGQARKEERGKKVRKNECLAAVGEKEILKKKNKDLGGESSIKTRWLAN